MNKYNYIVYGNNHFPMHFVIIRCELLDCVAVFNNSKDAHNFLCSELYRLNILYDFSLEMPVNILNAYLNNTRLYTNLENKQLYIKGV